MRYIGTTLVLLSLLVLPLTLTAQMTDQVEIKEITQEYDLGLSRRPSVPLIDLSRLNMSHAYSISFFSGNGQSGSVGMYNNMMTYKLADPLTLTLNLGILHNPGSLWGDKSFSNDAVFLPSGWLDWRPSKNVSLSIGFETLPAYNGYNNAGRYWYRNR
ncbi:MAG: hypothetical protein GY841_08545 [FCB group bacterium]|nr:hypothetical protein [FCB group bacterium]